MAIQRVVLGLVLAVSAGVAADAVAAAQSEVAPQPRAELVKDIRPGRPSALHDSLVPVGRTLFFPATNAAHGTELWKSDGTARSTVRVKHIARCIETHSNGRHFCVPNYLWPGELTAVGRTLFFVGQDGKHGTELWKSNGTPRGTVRVKHLASCTRVRRRGRTRCLTDYSWPAELTAVGRTLFFVTSDAVHGPELWKSDGSARGTVMVKDINPNPGSSPGALTAVGRTLFFVADDGIHGRELWKSDGTPAGTVLVKDINPVGQLTSVGDRLFFVATDGTHGFGLWVSDGTAAGTLLLQDLSTPAPRPGWEWQTLNLTDVDASLFFEREGGPGFCELWKSDGTVAGTVPVKNICAGLGLEAAIPSHFGERAGAVGRTFFFSADDGVHGMELWKTDGTAVGTVLVRDILPGPRSSSPNWLVDVDGTLYFRADDGKHSAELWKSDGTGEGTVLVSDISSTGSSMPVDLTVAGRTLFFTAYERAHGRELWRVAG